MHHPPFTATENEADSYYNWPLPVRQRLLALVRKFNVQHLLCGHTHTTTHVQPSDNAFNIYTVGGTARIFDQNGFGYRVFTIIGDTVSQEYVKLDPQS